MTTITSFTFKRIRRNADLAALDRDVAVANHLARGGAGVRKSEVKNHVVQARLQNLQHLFAGDTAAAQGFFIDAAKLLFHQAVVITELLLLDQTEAVIGVSCGGTSGRERRGRSCGVQDISSGRKSEFRNGG